MKNLMFAVAEMAAALVLVLAWLALSHYGYVEFPGHKTAEASQIREVQERAAKPDMPVSKGGAR